MSNWEHCGFESLMNEAGEDGGKRKKRMAGGHHTQSAGIQSQGQGVSYLGVRTNPCPLFGFQKYLPPGQTKCVSRREKNFRSSGPGRTKNVSPSILSILHFANFFLIFGKTSRKFINSSCLDVFSKKRQRFSNFLVSYLVFCPSTGKGKFPLG